MKKILLLISIVCAGMFIFININNASIRGSSASLIKNPVAEVILDNGEIFKIELYPNEAPNTVKNFIYLVNHHFYKDMPINKIVPGYLIQTGDPVGDGTGFPGYFIKSECRNKKIRNKLSQDKGIVSMCRGKEYHTEGSQLFIMLQEDASLNGQYTSFGKVIQGMEVLERIGNIPVDSSNRPLSEIFIKDISINTFGVDYEEPEVISLQEKIQNK